MKRSDLQRVNALSKELDALLPLAGEGNLRTAILTLYPAASGGQPQIEIAKGDAKGYLDTEIRRLRSELANLGVEA